MRVRFRGLIYARLSHRIEDWHDMVLLFTYRISSNPHFQVVYTPYILLTLFSFSTSCADQLIPSSFGLPCPLDAKFKCRVSFMIPGESGKQGLYRYSAFTAGAASSGLTFQRTVLINCFQNHFHFQQFLLPVHRILSRHTPQRAKKLS